MFKKWSFDADHLAVVAPSGLRITIRQIAQWIQDQVHNRFDLTGPWAGWKVRGQYLKAPGGLRVTQEALRQMLKEQRQTNPTDSSSVKSASTPEQAFSTGFRQVASDLPPIGVGNEEKAKAGLAGGGAAFGIEHHEHAAGNTTTHYQRSRAA